MVTFYNLHNDVYVMFIINIMTFASGNNYLSYTNVCV